MIKFSDNSIRLKFYSGDLPKYSILGTGLNVDSLIDPTRSSIISNGLISDIKYMNSYKGLKFLYGTSFSIVDEDLLIFSIRIFIGNDGLIYIGRLPDQELYVSVVSFLAYYLSGIFVSIDDHLVRLLSRLSIGSMITYIDINVVTKSMTINISEPKRITSGGSPYAKVRDHINKSMTIDLSRIMYRSSKESYDMYSCYVDNNT